MKSVFVLMVVMFCGLAGAQVPDAGATPAADTPTVAQVEASLAAVAGDASLDEAAKAKATAALETAKGHLQRAAADEAAAKELEQRIAAAPQQIEQVRQALAQPLVDPPDVAKISAGSAADVEKRQREVEIELEGTRSDLAAREQELASIRSDQATLRDVVANARTKLDEIETALSAIAVDSDTDRATAAQRTLLLARRAYRTAEIRLATIKQTGADTLTTLTSLQRDLAARRLRQIEPTAEAWRAAAARAKLRESARGVAASEQLAEQLADAPEPLPAEAARNVALGRELQEIQVRVTQTASDAGAAKGEYESLRREFDTTRARLESLEVDAEIGSFLRRRRGTLPKIAPRRELAAERRSKLSKAGAAQLDIDELRRALVDLEARIAAVVPNGPKASAEQRRLGELARQMLIDRREVLDKLHRAYGDVIASTGDTIATNQQLRDLADSYGTFIDSRLFWIRSEPPVEADDAGRVARGVGIVLRPSSWWQMAGDAWAGMRSSPWTWVPGLLAAIGLIVYRRRAVRSIRSIAGDIGKVRTDSFVLTIRAMVLTVAMSAGVPLLLGVIGINLVQSSGVGSFSAAAGAGFVVVALVVFFLGFLRNLCMDKGVGDVHFGWPESSRVPFRRVLFWLIAIAVVAAFCVGFTVRVDNEELRRGLGRLGFAAGMLSLGGGFGWVLRPWGPVMNVVAERSPQSWVHRMRWVWYPLGLATFAALVVMTLSGFYFTAHQMMIRVRYTLWLAAGVVLLNQMLVRWLNVTHRRLAYQEAVRKRLAQRRAQAAADDADGGSKPPTSEIVVAESEIPLAQINDQTRAMLRTIMSFAMLIGLYLIWSDVLPALNLLDDVHLWSYQTTVDGVDQVLPVTLIDFIAALLWVVVAIVGAKNLPGVLELLLLNRLPIDAGTRYAVTSVSRYVITGVGIVGAFAAIGVGWTDVQWLIAALSIGLGFGLQEIIANFVSGLILLFERPIRVGDTVTIGDTTGTVTKIRIRATTIVNWERKELVVPNKEFITGRLLNWTLSDAVNRIVINVGVAYGSDTRRAYELLIEAAKQHPDVLDDPEPRANFDAFGDSSLNFVLRIYLVDMVNRLKVIHEMHTAIDDKFRDAGIEIAFPQRDVHLDTGGGPLELRWADDSAGSSKPGG